MINSRLIEKKAKLLLDKAGLFEVPIDINKVADLLNIEVIENDPDDDGLSGALIRNEDKTIIYINKTHSDARKRFTLAHELGHFILHKSEKSFVDGKKTQVLLRANTGGVKNNMETEANIFAASILMPEFLIKKLYGELLFAKGPNEDDVIIKMSETFKVSYQAMGYRFVNLGYGI